MSQPIYLNSINYQRAEWLQKQVGGSSSLFRVLDAIIFTCQNSKFQEDGKRTACPGIERIAQLALVSVRTAKNHIKKLKYLGLIKTKVKKLYNGTTRCFFWLCDIVFKLLKEPDHKKYKSPSEASNHAGSAKAALPGSAKAALPYIERKNLKEKNTNNSYCYQNLASTQSNATSGYCVTAVTVNFQQVEKEVLVKQSPAKPTAQDVVKPTVKPKDTNPYIINDKLTKRQIAIAHGSVNNLMKDGVPVSNPKQLKAEVVFKIEQKHKDAGGDNLQHQINSAMKLIRAGKWTTPHGFYKYSEAGREANKMCEEAERAAEGSKYDAFVPTLPDHFKDLLNLDLSGVGQGSKKVDAGSQIATESEVTSTNNVLEGGPVGLSPKTPLSTKDRLATTSPQSRIDILNASIARCQAKLAVVSGSAKDALLGLIQRLNDELQSLACAC